MLATGSYGKLPSEFQEMDSQMSNQMQPLRFVLYLVDGPPEIAAEQWSFSDVKYMELETLELGKTNANQMTMAIRGAKLASAKAAVVK